MSRTALFTAATLSDDGHVHGRIVGRLDSRVEIIDGVLHVSIDGRSTALHPLWLRERSVAVDVVDPDTRQRLIEPLDVGTDLRVVDASFAEYELAVTFSDGTQMALSFDDLIADLGVGDGRCDALPSAVPWRRRDVDLVDHEVRYESLADADDRALAAALGSFFRHGWFVLRGAPAREGALHAITAHFGRLSPTNFGAIFDVRTARQPADLAYTSVALSAHTDQPYRTPVPGLQFLHTIVNDARGGESIVVDGLAAVRDLAIADADASAALCTTAVEFRYDIGTDVVIARVPMIELHPDGGLRQLRYSPRLDFAPLLAPEQLEPYYRGRRWLAAELNDPARRVQFRLGSGDVLVVDNHRVLHGRAAFDPTSGARHLQGCYIDHDGPATAWRLLRRRQRAAAERPPR